MFHPRKYLAASLLVLLASPAYAQSTMVGTWFGQGQPNSKESMYIDRMRPDGSWRGEYRTCIKGKSSDQIQEGRWSLSGDTLAVGSYGESSNAKGPHSWYHRPFSRTFQTRYPARPYRRRSRRIRHRFSLCR